MNNAMTTLIGGEKVEGGYKYIGSLAAPNNCSSVCYMAFLPNLSCEYLTNP